jgi:2-aminoadipate transaminase
MARTAKRQTAAPGALGIELSRGNGHPLFMQLHEQIVDQIAAGELAPGTRLPPVRKLARQLDINPMTVAKAYKDLAEKGFVESRAGGGTHVRSPSSPVTRRPRAAREELSDRPLLSERLFELAHAPGVIAFTGNFPTVDQACIEELKACMATVMAGDLVPLLNYDPPTGSPELRRRIADYIGAHGIAVSPDELIVTSGAQQAIDLTIRCLVPPGAPVVIERPCYYGVINSLRAVRARILEVPMEDDGMDMKVLEAHLSRHRPRLIYTNPTFQNPTGITTSEEKRRTMLALARRYGAAILEDDHNSELRFAGRPLPSIRALAEPDDAVFYARGFGKVFLPGTRVGYLLVPPNARRALLAMKAHADLHANTIMQEAMALFLARRNFGTILERMKKHYSAKQRRLVENLTRGMPPGTEIGRPEGGLSLWLTLPEGTEVSELYFRAVRRGVAFVAGEVFYASHANPRTLRVSFGLVSAEVLDEGVDRLCSVANDLMRPRSASSPIFI